MANAKVYPMVFDTISKASFGNIDFDDENSLIRFVPEKIEAYLDNNGAFKNISRRSITPAGYVSLNPASVNALTSKMRFANSIVKGAHMEKVISEIETAAARGGGHLAIEANVARLMTLDYSRGSHDLLKIADLANNLFKRNKLLSPAFNIRNFLGVTTNMWLSGMSVKEISYYMGQADKVFKNAKELFPLKASLTDIQWETLLAKNPEMAAHWKAAEWFTRGQFTTPKTLKEAMEKGLEGTGSQVQDIAGGFIKPISEAKPGLKTIDKVSIANGWGNETIDSYGRMAVLLKALDGEKGIAYMKRLNVNDPIEAVRLSMFDPKALSLNEDEIMKRLVPFYTFTKMNLAYHMKNIPNNAVRYHRMYKAVNASWNAMGINPQDVENYKLDQMYVPLPGLTKEGKYYAIKANFPQSDVAEFVSNPLGRSLSMVTPLIRAPFEVATGTSIFSGRPIENFTGERSASLPFLTKKQEYLLSQSGLDVPLRSAYGAVKVAQGDVMGGMSQLTNMGSQGNVNNSRLSKKYDVLEDLQAGVSQLKQQDIILPKITIQAERNVNPKLSSTNIILDKLLNKRLK
jgi:hypothetical protein